MLYGICFHRNPNFVDLWDQLVRTYDVENVYEIDMVEPSDGIWERVQEPPSPRILFSPSSARYTPGTVSLYDFVHKPSYTYYFGTDFDHGEYSGHAESVYIPTPLDIPLWSVQAASIVLQNLWVRHG